MLLGCINDKTSVQIPIFNETVQQNISPWKNGYLFKEADYKVATLLLQQLLQLLQNLIYQIFDQVIKVVKVIKSHLELLRLRWSWPVVS